MPEILDDNDTNLLVQHEDNSVELVPLSPMNSLLFRHELWGVLRDGDEILVFAEHDDRPQVSVTPDDDARTYTIQVGDCEPLLLGAHLKSRLIKALQVVYEKHDGSDPQPLIDLHDDIREGQVRQHVVGALAEVAPFSERVEVLGDGWMINERLLLTWENEFYHPGTTSRRVAGSSVAPASSENAYEVSFETAPSDGPREITLDGTTYRLTNSEMEFVARALWGMKATPAR